jgi:HSP20 family protein
MSDKATETRRPLVRPGCTVCETGDGRIQVKVEMPGVRQESLEVRIEGNELRVLGRRDDQEGFAYLVRERRPGDFFQAWTLDETIDQSKVEAVLRNGVLTLTLDLKEQVKPRTIEIRGE